MKGLAENEVPVAAQRDGSVTRGQIRGSSLLLAGRLMSVGVNFLSQVLIVRHLTKGEYGAWAYALAVVAFCHGFVALGLDRAITRFLPIYHEKSEYHKLFGTVVLVVGSTLLAGFALVAVFYLFPEQLARLINEKQQPIALLYIMIFLVPVEALDALLIGLFAAFGNSRAIFFRRYVLGPTLKLTVVLLLILRGSEVTFLAFGYLLASLLGVAIYSWELVRMFRREGLFEKLRLSGVAIPAREVLAFTIPLMTSDLVTVLMHSSDALLLGYFWGLEQVALFRVVLPAAMLNQLVMRSFALLYTPAAARLFAKADHRGINELYWRTTLWMAVLSFPIFAVTFSLATPLTVFLYGERYAESGIILALLSLGYYFNVALGFNGLTLKVLGKLRYVVTINVLAALTNIFVNLLFIPRYGALGAAIGTAGTMIVHNVLKQAGLRLASGVSLFEKTYLTFYLTVAAGAAALLIARLLWSGNIFFWLVLAAAVSLAVLFACRSNLKIAETFPEIRRLRVVQALLT